MTNKKQLKLTKELLQVKSIRSNTRSNYLLVIKDNTTNIINNIIIDSNNISIRKYCKDNNINLYNYENSFCNTNNYKTKKLANSCLSDDLNLDFEKDYKNLMGFLTGYIKDWESKVIEDDENLLLKVKTITKDINTNY